MISGGGHVNLKQLQRAMFFIDGTNLFHRLQSSKLIVSTRLTDVFNRQGGFCGHREIVRFYLYSIEKHVDAAVARHGPKFLEGVRVVLGDGIVNQDGGIKEKGVDALLVADLIYHAASRNCDYAVLVSTDTDFKYAIKRVEDFGCRTATVGVCCDVPDRLKQSSDNSFSLTAKSIVDSGCATFAS